MSRVTTYDEYIGKILPSIVPYDFADKNVNIANQVRYALARTRNMFEWRGLPDTVPERLLEIMLQTNGHVGWLEVDNKLYVMNGGLGGEPDAYYMPTIYTVSNPYLSYSANLRIGEDCIVMPSDSMYMGLLPLLSYYATAQTENRITMNIYDILTRIPAMITAPDDRSRKSAEKFLGDIISGKYGIIADNQFFDGIKTLPISATSQGKIMDLIEYEQYLKASMYNEIGLNANYNMKREALNTSETEKDNNSMLPLMHDMLNNRKEYAEKVNAMFGRSIEVDFASAWKLFDEECKGFENKQSGQTESTVAEEKKSDESEEIE